MRLPGQTASTNNFTPLNFIRITTPVPWMFRPRNAARRKQRSAEEDENSRLLDIGDPACRLNTAQRAHIMTGWAKKRKSSRCRRSNTKKLMCRVRLQCGFVPATSTSRAGREKICMAFSRGPRRHVGGEVVTGVVVMVTTTTELIDTGEKLIAGAGGSTAWSNARRRWPPGVKRADDGGLCATRESSMGNWRAGC